VANGGESDKKILISKGCGAPYGTERP